MYDDLLLKKLQEAWFLIEEVPPDVLGQTSSKLTHGDKRKQVKSEAKEKVREIADLITTPYEDLPRNEGGSHVHLPKIIDWVIDGVDVNQIKREYDSFMSLPKELKNKVNFKSVKDFTKFAELVHSAQSSQIQIDKGEHTDNSKLNELMKDEGVKSALVFQNEDVAVFEGTTEEVTRKLSCGNKYGLCIGRDPGKSWFVKYRFQDNQTTYFVYFKTKESSRFNYGGETRYHSSPFIIIDNLGDGKWEWNLVMNLDGSGAENRDVSTNPRKMVEMFPVLDGLFQKGVFDWKEPNNDAFIKWMKENPSYSYNYAKERGWENTPPEIRQIAIERMKGRPVYAYAYALKWKLENTPEEIRQIAIEWMKGNSTVAYNYAEKWGWENTPIEILQIPKVAYMYAEEKGWENTPEEIRQSAIEWLKRNPDDSYWYAKEKGLENTPEEIRQIVIEGMKENPNYAYNYAEKWGWENTPLEILQIPKVAYIYAKERGWENTPEEIREIAIGRMKRNPNYAYNYAEKWGLENTPEEIRQISIWMMEENPYNAYIYAKERGWENTPEEIRQIAIEAMKKNPDYAYWYAKEKGLENTPEEIRQIAIERMKGNPWDVEKYKQKWGSLPPELQNLNELFTPSKPKFKYRNKYTDYEENDEEFYTVKVDGIKYVLEVDWRVNDQYDPPYIIEPSFGIKNSKDLEDFDDESFINKVDPTRLMATLFDIVKKGVQERGWEVFHLVASPRFTDSENIDSPETSRRGSFYKRSIERLIRGSFNLLDYNIIRDDDGEGVMVFTLQKGF